MEVQPTKPTKGADMKKQAEVIPTFQQLHNRAMETLLSQLVLKLHESGKLDARSLIAKIESGQAFAQAAFRAAPNPVLPELLRHLSQLLDAMEQEQKP
jgi:hypothetical protein